MWIEVTGATQGRGHVKTQTPCQDKVFSLSDKGVDIVALADGAGSAKMSHFGAECITHFICSEMVNQFDNIYSNPDGVAVKKQLMTSILEQLNTLKTELNCELSDLASTLLFVAVKGNTFILLHIGDGVIGYWKNGELKVASHPTNGEFANTTVFTTSPEAIVSMKMAKGQLNDINGFILMSDGTAMSLYNHRTKTLNSAIQQIFQRCILLPKEEVQAQLDGSLKEVFVMNTSDDCSLGILVRPSDQFAGYDNLTTIEKLELFQIEYNRHIPFGKRIKTRSGFAFRNLQIRRFQKRYSLRKYTKQIVCYETLLRVLQQKRSLKNLISTSRLHKRVLLRELKYLLDIGLIIQTDGMYSSKIRLD